MKTNKYVNIIRSLGIQAIKLANQGHPGMAISAAPIIYAIYTSDFQMDWSDPQWINRDRLVLSAGHGCMALYPIIHLLTEAFYQKHPEADHLTMAELKSFRKANSRTPGHPEVHLNPWLDATTGPLGQGVAQAVGMAIAEANLRANQQPVNHWTYAVVGDGDLQEGISYEAMSLAGRLALNKLVVLHDSNAFQLESAVSEVNNEDLQKRMESMHWFYQKVGNDPAEIQKAIRNAKEQSKPSFIEVVTIIGEGLPYANSDAAHGGSISDEALKSFREYYDLDDQDFTVPQDVYDYFYETVIQPGQTFAKRWKEKNSNRTERHFFHKIHSVLQKHTFTPNVATRISAKEVIQVLNNHRLIDDLFFLSADLSKSTNIALPSKTFNDDAGNNFLKLGVREFAMGAIATGITLHGGLQAVTSTFLAFSDYMKAAMRLATIAEAYPIFVFTHDSILLGSDGPTHQPVEQLAMLRTIPGMNVFRPADGLETAAAFTFALSRRAPTTIVLSRQNVNLTQPTNFLKSLSDGGYAIEPELPEVDFHFYASGSELPLSLQVCELLNERTSFQGKVFSVPNLNLFLKQKHQVPKVGMVIMEASNDPSWYQLLPSVPKLVINVKEFGQSMDGVELYRLMGFDPEQIWIKMQRFFQMEEK